MIVLYLLLFTKYFNNMLQKKNIFEREENYCEVKCQLSIDGPQKNFPSQCLFFERAINFTISLYYNKNVGSSLLRDILCNVHIDQMNSFLKHFGIHSFHIDFRILRNLRGAFRAISNSYDEAFSHCIISEMHHHKYLARQYI